MPEINEIKVGGEEMERQKLPVENEDGTPAIYTARIKSYRQKPGKPTDDGRETTYFGWTFEVTEGKYKGAIVYGSTNAEARRSYTTKKPLKLLRLIMATNGGKEPGKGTVISLSDLKGKVIRVTLMNKGEGEDSYQLVEHFYPHIQHATEQQSQKVDEDMDGLDVINLDAE